MPNTSPWMGREPQALCRTLQHGSDTRIALRRGTIVASLIGVGAMAATTLLQMGVVRRLPDPPVGRFDTVKVNSSDEAYSYGGPDSRSRSLRTASTWCSPPSAR